MQFDLVPTGIEAIMKRFDSEKPLTGEALSLILKPIGHFHKHLSVPFGKLAFEPVRLRTLKYIKDLNLAELPSREYEAISETLSVVKNLTVTPEGAAEIDRCEFLPRLPVCLEFGSHCMYCLAFRCLASFVQHLTCDPRGNLQVSNGTCAPAAGELNVQWQGLFTMTTFSF